MSATTMCLRRRLSERGAVAAEVSVDGKNFIFGDEWHIDGANISIWRIGEISDRDGWKVWWDSEGGWGYAQMHGYIGLGMLFVNAL